MADVSIYAAVISNTALTRAQWQASLAQVTGHPIIASINNGGGIHPANKVALTPKCEEGASATHAVLSFIMLDGQRSGMRQYALGVIQANQQAFLDWCTANSLNPALDTTQYSYVFSVIAAQAGVQNVICLVVGFDEDWQVAAATMRAHVEANAAHYYDQE